MKRLVKNILNEARVQRTIDPKIWASMSSMSSRLRSTLGQDAKPMKKDDINTLLQKYVAGLLTMKVDCPNNVSEIDDIKAYKLIGNEYINQGGTIADIQKLYVENGGKLNGNTSSISQNDNISTYDKDDIDEYIPDYDSVDIDNITNDDIDDSEIIEEPANTQIQQHDFNNAVKTQKTSAIKKMELSNTQKYIKTYLKGNREILAAPQGSLLEFDENTGMFIISNPKIANGEFPVCTGRGFSNIDKKTRFMLISNEEYELGNAGNNSVYEDYYFKKNMTSTGRITITPGSNYYADEVTKGKFYTEILAENGMIPAMHVQDVVAECDITDPNALEVLKVSAYLPTLPELTNIITMLPDGTYWTSSIAKNGTSNIALSVNPDKVLANCETAKIVVFIRFD